MRTLKVIFLIPLLLLIPILSQSSDLDYMRSSLLDGDVQIKTEDMDDWVPASINMPLREGDRIWVPEGGRAEFQLRDGSYLRLGQESALEILSLDRNSSQFYLTEGRAYAYFKGPREGLLQIDTPQSSVRAYDPSRFGVDVAREGRTDISVYRGSVYAESQDGKTRVEEGKTLTVGEGDYSDLAPLGPMDNWENWNRERDRRLVETRPSPRYLPEELHTYSRDFEDNGRWVHDRDYGYVWRPTVVVSAGWAPYRHGRWTWVGGDYVWISYEPWGWAPYHYGRWAFVVNFGWCWVPPARGAVYWGPGFVGWVYTPTYVAWVPLAPREIYYGYGYYGPHSVNITNVNITNINVTNVKYKYVNVRNAVTVVHHDTFVRGKHVPVDTKENPFVGRRIHVGRPDIKPEKASRMPVVREVPESRRPPEKVRQVHVKELKERRPMVKEKEASVMRPASPPKEMQIRTIDRKPVERPKEVAPTEKKAQKPRETKPQDKATPKPKETKPPESGTSKPRESKPPEKAAPPTKPTDKDVERPKETKPQEKGVEKPKETRPPEKNTGSPRETRPPEKSGVEKPKEYKPADKGVEPPKESRPSSKANMTRPPESQPPKTVERPGQVTPPSKGNGKGVEARPAARPVEKPKAVQPVEKNVPKGT